MIDIKNVTKTYAKNKKKAVDDLTLHVNGGEDANDRFTAYYENLREE